MSDLPKRNVPLIQPDENTGAMTAPWYGYVADAETRLEAVEVKTSAGSDLFAYAGFGGL